MRTHNYDHLLDDDHLHDDPAPRRGRRPTRPPADPPPAGDRWSTWATAEHGPVPRPQWLITESAATDTELGVLKTGKEADVHLVERGVPGTERSCLLAAKRYRSAEHRMFHRDTGYLEGRRVRRSRETRAMANRTAFGRSLLGEQWAAAEFGALWHQLTGALHVLAGIGLTHGDLSAYNLLVCDSRLFLIDLPQVVDVVANPQGPAFLERDVRTVTAWFAARGLPAETADPSGLQAALLDAAGVR